MVQLSTEALTLTQNQFAKMVIFSLFVDSRSLNESLLNVPRTELKEQSLQRSHNTKNTIPEFGNTFLKFYHSERLRQEDHKFNPNLGNLVSK